MSTYPFENITVNKPGACDQYIRSNIDWVSNFNGLSTVPLTIYTLEPLTDTQLSALTILINGYTDPEVFLSFDHSSNLPMHTHTNDCMDLTVIDNKSVLQTIIYEINNSNNTIVLDSIKTIVEYTCPNVQNFLNKTQGTITLEIFDITRNTIICTEIIELNEIATKWNTMAQTGSTEKDPVYRSHQFTGLRNVNPNYDTVWQLRANIDTIDFCFACNGLQYLYYNVQ